MVRETALYKQNTNMVSRDILGETILVPIRQDVGDMESIYTLNETAAIAWSMFDGEHTVEEIRDRIVHEFAVSEDEALQDLHELIEQLQEIGALDEA